MDPQMQAFFASLIPGPTTWYIVALFAGLYAQYQAARTNGRTIAASFKDYWFKETPGASVATGIALLFAAGATIKGGSLASMSTWEVLEFGFAKAFLFDAVIQFPSAKSDVPAPNKGAGFIRLELLAVLLGLALLAGCAGLARLAGEEAPQTPKESITYTYSELAAARKSILNASMSGLLSLSAEEQAEKYADQVRTGLDAARTGLRGCIDLKGQPVTEVAGLTQAGAAAVLVQQIRCNPSSTARDQLALSTTLLGQLSKYLNEQQAAAAAKK